jgi:diacylglycerol O-acyltransferase / wax synthase
VAIMSYAGEMNFGLLGDFDALPDIEEIGDNIAEELATLVELAHQRQAQETQTSNASENGDTIKGASNTPRRTSRPRSSSRASTEA